jgi:hypothetical protein
MAYHRWQGLPGLDRNYRTLRNISVLVTMYVYILHAIANGLTNFAVASNRINGVPVLEQRINIEISALVKEVFVRNKYK